jgi:hypothetical protein
LNDAVILGWPQFSELRHLDIRDTRVTGAGLKRLISGGKISRLVLNHSSVTSEDLDTLSECRELSELMLAGIGIESENLAAIFANQSLKQLDLSDSELKPAIFVELIDGGETLEFLVLRNCEIDDRKLTALARKYPLIQFDLNGSTASSSVITQLLVSERIVEVADRNILREMQRRYTAVRAGISLLDKLPPSIIDIEPFAEMRQAGNP